MIVLNEKTNFKRFIFIRGTFLNNAIKKQTYQITSKTYFYDGHSAVHLKNLQDAVSAHHCSYVYMPIRKIYKSIEYHISAFNLVFIASNSWNY